MVTRSRGGCIDCKRAKVKCDEVHPSCGTCARRGYVCRGFLRKSSIRIPASGPHTPSRIPAIQPKPGPLPDNETTSAVSPQTVYLTSRKALKTAKNNQEEHEANTYISGVPSSQRDSPMTAQAGSDSDMDTRPLPALSLRSVSSIPAGIIPSADEPIIEMYFERHPSELVISGEFVHEMNSNVLQVFHKDPMAVADSLSAIGHIYLGGGGQQSIVPFLDRKARILARLRAMNGVGHDLEQMLVILLGLCALELIDEASPPKESALPALLASTAFIIKHHVTTRKKLSSLAKYFMRALARQDMMISLALGRGSLIATEYWLDDECRRHADRYMGLTTTLMPILADLTSLAEDVRATTKGTAVVANTNMDDVNNVKSETVFLAQDEHNFQRAVELRNRLHKWYPLSDQRISFQSSKSLIFHAYSVRAAALLYLHRIVNPPGSSAGADQRALSMAHEVLMYIGGPLDVLKMSLWPTFIAGCELTNEDDRLNVVQSFDTVFHHRKTVTALRIKDFVINRVWKARDSGTDWNWMVLAYQYPGECVPI